MHHSKHFSFFLIARKGHSSHFSFLCLLGEREKKQNRTSKSGQSLNPGAPPPGVVCGRRQSGFLALRLARDMKGGVDVRLFAVVLSPACVLAGLLADCAVRLPSAPHVGEAPQRAGLSALICALT